MEYRQLGKTSLYVSPICIGTVQFGTGLDRDSSFWQLDAFTEGGANFIDTARVYGDWVEGERARSEKLIGQWIKKRGNRDRLVILTKGAHPLLQSMDVSRCTPADIRTDIEGSLLDLGIDQIDLYLLHRDNTALPVGPLLDELEKARLEGKIKHYGFSNWTLSRAREAEDYTRKTGIEGFSCNQIRWSLAEINAENIADKTTVAMDVDFYKWHCESLCSLTAYTSTARGWFSKLAKGEEVPERLKSIYAGETNDKIFSRIQEASRDLNISVHNISLAYMREHPFSALPVTSFSKKEQLEEALKSCDIVLPDVLDVLMEELNQLKGL